jgi:hypothetical protein
MLRNSKKLRSSTAFLRANQTRTFISH